MFITLNFKYNAMMFGWGILAIALIVVVLLRYGKRVK